MSINQRTKGASVERKIAGWLRENGDSEARRTQQYSGTGGTSDVVSGLLPDWHIESKATKNPPVRSVLLKWFSQIERDCPKEKYPVIINVTNGHGESAENWAAILPVEAGSKLLPHIDPYLESIVYDEFNFVDKLNTLTRREALSCVCAQLHKVSGKLDIHTLELIYNTMTRQPVLVYEIAGKIYLVMRATTWLQGARELSSF